MQIWNRLSDANQQTNCVVVGKTALKALCTPSSTGKACCWCASASHCCHLYSAINQSIKLRSLGFSPTHRGKLQLQPAWGSCH